MASSTLSNINQGQLFGYINNAGVCTPVIKTFTVSLDGTIADVVYLNATTNAVYTLSVGDVFQLDGCGSDYEIVTSCHKVITAGAWGAIGDILTRYEVRSITSTGVTVQPATYVNNNDVSITGLFSTIPATAYDDCEITAVTVSHKVWDYLANGEPVELIAVYTVNAGTATVQYYTMTGVAYTPVGTILEAQDQSVNKGMVSITVPANTVTSLPVAPAYTSFATVKFVNGTYWVRTDGVAPTVGVAGNASPYVTRDELQLFNNDITGFRVISSTATRIVVEWRNHQHVMAQ